MKRALLVFLAVILFFPLLADVYKYTDEKGNVYFVDSIYKVPLNYRKSVEVLPSGKDINEQEKPFANIFLKKENKGKVGDLYTSFVLSRIKGWLILLSLVFVIFLFIVFHSKDFLWAVNLLLLFFLLFEGVYLFAVYPSVKRATIVYSYLTKHYLSNSLSPADRVKKYSLENAVSKNPIPLNPYAYYKKVRLLKEFYNEISIEVSVDGGK